MPDGARKKEEADREGIGLEKRGRRRQSLETKENMIRVRSRLDTGLAKDEAKRCPSLSEYSEKFGDGSFAYLPKGRWLSD